MRRQISRSRRKIEFGKLAVPELGRAGTNGSCPAVFRKPPNPNATKVFINWLLSQQGQKSISEARGEPSARTDIPVTRPEDAPKPEWIISTLIRKTS